MGTTEPKRRTNLEAADWPDDRASEDLGRTDKRTDRGDSAEHAEPLAHHALPEIRNMLTREEADRLAVLTAGTRLEAGSTYFDLRQRARGPFIGQAGDVVRAGQLIVAKRDVDHELWNRLVGADH